MYLPVASVLILFIIRILSSTIISVDASQSRRPNSSQSLPSTRYSKDIAIASSSTSNSRRSTTRTTSSRPPRSTSTRRSRSSTRGRASTCATDDDDDDDANAQNRACSFFVWDVTSLIRYKVCTYLLRRNVYEAKGGRKLVRIRPGSVLEYLYPVSQHAPDKCALCGRSFDDHLTRWWKAKGLVGTPYDKMLDDIYNEGVSVTYSVGGAGCRSDSGGGQDDDINSDRAIKVLSFHKRYVQEIPDKKQAQHQEQHLRQSKGRRKETIKRSRTRSSNEWRRNPRKANESRSTINREKKKQAAAAAAVGASTYEDFTDGPISYRVPRFNFTGLNIWEAGVLALARAVVLDEYDSIIDLQSKENRLLERKANPY